MSLAALVSIPPGPNGFSEWSWAHVNHHRAIITAAAEGPKKARLLLYQIWPINRNAFEDWLLQHQSQHTDMCGLYGVNGSDLSTLDPTNQKELSAWVSLHFQEHRDVAQASGAPI